MTETRPTALQLAEFLENLIADPMWPDHFELSKRLSVNVVEELRRLYQENQALRDRLAQPEHEWVGLTDEEIFDIADKFGSFQYGDAQGHKRLDYAKAIEAKLKEKNA